MAPVWSLPPFVPSEPLRWELLEEPVLPTRAEPPSPRLSPLTIEQVNFVINHIQFSKRQRSFAQGGFTVNTAVVPPYNETDIWVGVDSVGTINGFVGYSLSNVFQLQLARTSYSQVPKLNLQTDGTYSGWRIGAKAVPFSPQRNSPFWAGGRITVSTKNSYYPNSDDKSPGVSFLFVEAMVTLEVSSSWALNFNPKIAVSEASDLWGLGFSSNSQLSPSWQLVAEVNLRPDNLQQSNGTVGFRWQPIDNLMVDFYGSTAYSTSELSQFTNTDKVQYGTRLLMSF